MRSYYTEAGKAALWNWLWLAVYTVLTQGCYLAVLILLTSALEPGAFAAFSAAITLFNYLIITGSAGTGGVVLREVAFRPHDRTVIETSFFVVTAGSSIAVAAAAIVGALSFSFADDERALLILTALGVIPYSMSLAPLYTAVHRQALCAAIVFATELGGLMAIAALASSARLSLAAVGVVLLLKWLLATIAQAVIYHFWLRRLGWAFSGSDVKQLLRTCWPMLLATFAYALPLSAGIFFVRTLSSENDSAAFGLAVQCALAYQLLMALGLRIVQPHINGMFGLHRQFVKKLLVFVVASGILLSLVAFAGGAIVVYFLDDPAYQAAIGPMAILLLTAFLMSLASVANVYLLRFSDLGFIVLIHLAVVVAYLTAMVLLAATMTITVAAVVALIAQFIAAALLCGRAAMWIAECASSP
ncbi:MAG: oligosaccharide flippase family protein [Opitutaceae bacterium]|nr:oligosaccharide flippase family protein [Opitutaceae bacterium]